MKITLILLTALVMACSHRAIQAAMTFDATVPTHAIRFLSLGDSYTIGESVMPSSQWSRQLAVSLRQQKLDVGDPTIIAKTGWTTDELQTAITQSGNKNTYGLVSLMVGVNNQYRGQSLEKYRTEFRELAQTAIRFAGGKANRVFVLSTPDWGVSPYAAGRDQAKVAAEIDAFNQVAQNECQKAGIAYVDITPLTRTAAGDATQFADDGLHYSGKQMHLWAEQALPTVKGLLAK